MIRITVFAMCAMVILSCTGPRENLQVSNEVPPLVPRPVSLDMKSGTLVLDGKIFINAQEGLANEADMLLEVLSDSSTWITVMENGPDANVFLRLDDTIRHPEGYHLEVTPKGIYITSGTAKGCFYGIQTLIQLLVIHGYPSKTGALALPAMQVEDYPRFSYRGMHLDVGRHFFGVPTIKKFIDMLALHKMNRFHWHLTEDQGWRIQIDKFPKLTEVGSYRNGTIEGHYPGVQNDNKVYGGFYTKEQIREVVAYATQRHVEIIPEIELPGHSQAAIASYPELSCFPDSPTIVPNNMISRASKAQQQKGHVKTVQESWGIHPDVYCAGKEGTFAFLEGVLDEVIALFPSEYIHIGGDECPKDNWERCPSCQQRMKQENLVDENELQSYVIERIERYLNAKGKKIIGWDEILEGGLAPNATVMSWRGMEGGIEAVKLKHNVIMTPTNHCYFDYYQTKNTESEPLAIGGFLPVEQVYAFEPVPEQLGSDERHYVLGAQGNLWTEYIRTESQLEYMALPRATALAEVLWSTKEGRDYGNFKERLMDFQKVYQWKGLNYAKHVFIFSDSTKVHEP